MKEYSAKILVVDDEPRMRELISLYLTDEKYKVSKVKDGEQALQELENQEFDLFIIDVMMPQMDGFTLCRRIRAKTDKPVIFLTAKGEEYERLIGFELGADDYIVKPFSPNEMVARVKAVLRRTQQSKSHDEILYGDLFIDLEGRTVKVGKSDIILTPKEFDLLVYLIRNSGRVLSREQITEKVWGYDYYGDSRTVDTHVKRIREKLGDPIDSHIKTIWGVGYKFEVN